MNCVGIDVSKDKSMIAVMRPLGEMVVPPFEVGHTDVELCELSSRLRELDGETRVVMEATGKYHLPVVCFLHDSGSYVSVVNAMLVHSYGNNSLRRAKTDKKDAIKLANYGPDHWLALPRYILELVECFFQKLKWFRRIATRYDKLDTSFLTFVYLASIAILLIYRILPYFSNKLEITRWWDKVF